MPAKPRAGLVAGKLILAGDVGGRLMLSEGLPGTRPGPIRIGVSTSWDAILRVGVRAPCFGVAAPTLGERAGLDIFYQFYLSILYVLQQIAALLNLVIAGDCEQRAVDIYAGNVDSCSSDAAAVECWQMVAGM